MVPGFWVFVFSSYGQALESFFIGIFEIAEKFPDFQCLRLHVCF
jgi:hypothetical protein